MKKVNAVNGAPKLPVVVQRPTSAVPEKALYRIVAEFDDFEEARAAYNAIANWGGYEDITSIVVEAESVCASCAGRQTSQVRVELDCGEEWAQGTAQRIRDVFDLGDRCVVQAGISFSGTIMCVKLYGDLARLIEDCKLPVGGDPYCMDIDDLRRAVREALKRRIQCPEKEDDVDELCDALESIEVNESA